MYLKKPSQNEQSEKKGEDMKLLAKFISVETTLYENRKRSNAVTSPPTPPKIGKGKIIIEETKENNRSIALNATECDDLNKIISQKTIG